MKKPAKKRRAKSVEDGQEFAVYDGMRKLGDVVTSRGKFRATIGARRVGAFKKLTQAAAAISAEARGGG